MSQFRDDVVATDIVYFHFAVNATTGAADDGSTPLYDVRLCGGAAGDAPVASGTPTLLTHANYSPGLYEIAIDTTGYADGEYAVFITVTVSTVGPAGHVGNFRVRTANRIDAIKTVTDQLAQSAKTIVEGVCAALGTTTVVIASTLSPDSAVNDQFKNRIIIFTEDTTTVALRGQATSITGYVHATKTFTVAELTTAPALNDVFVIL